MKTVYDLECHRCKDEFQTIEPDKCTFYAVDEKCYLCPKCQTEVKEIRQRAYNKNKINSY